MAQDATVTTALGVDRNQYQKEQDKLLTTLLEYRFFNPWRSIVENPDDSALSQDANVELYISAKCNQKCEYCYLYKHPEIYPPEFDKPELILHNLELLYKYFIANKFFIPTLDMFSGEVWHTKLGLDILELTYDYALKGLGFNTILIASNCYFVNNVENLHKIQTLIDKFAMIGKKLVFSISVDGKIIDDYDRPRNNNDNYTDEYYDLLFAFARHNTFYFHPMISSKNVHLWHENFQWWLSMYDKYQLDFFTSMLLEVRNDDWTDESIDEYCKFIVELGDYYLKVYCNNDIERFANILANVRINPQWHFPCGYHPWAITGEVDSFASCTIPNHLTVRLGDLAICPCHRTAYAKYLYGHFVVEDDMICGITANNPQMAIKILMSNMKTAMHGCDTCLYRDCCLKGCFGSQFEATGDPFFPCPTVCKLFKKKYSTLLKHYADLGVFKYYETFSAQEIGAESVMKLLQLYKNWEAAEHGMGKCREDFSSGFC